MPTSRSFSGRRVTRRFTTIRFEAKNERAPFIVAESTVWAQQSQLVIGPDECKTHGFSVSRLGGTVLRRARQIKACPVIRMAKWPFTTFANFGFPCGGFFGQPC